MMVAWWFMLVLAPTWAVPTTAQEAMGVEVPTTRSGGSQQEDLRELAKFHPWAAIISATQDATGVDGSSRRHSMLLDHPANSAWEVMLRYSTSHTLTTCSLATTTIFVLFMLFSAWGIKDVRLFGSSLFQKDMAAQLVAAAAKGEGYGSTAAPSSAHSPAPEVGEGFAAGSGHAGLPPPPLAPWSMLGLLGLTSYRFYTGFLSATWLPYLLAMEGQDLWRENQSIFMGIAKLIYAATVLLNPLFGLLGDSAVTVSRPTGRRLFVRAGVTIAAIGIYISVTAERHNALVTFLVGVLLWRLGEAINDVTTEALVPELVPVQQFQAASAIKACSFLLGGLLGYVLLIIFSNVHYSWLYWAYPIGMFVCAVPGLVLLEMSEPAAGAISAPRRRPEHAGLFVALSHAYVEPGRLRGGFPRACLAVFVFSLGTAPMFFLLLVIRDLVGIQNAVQLQEQFSYSSILFFLSAAAATAISALTDGDQRTSRPAATGGTGDEDLALAAAEQIALLEKRSAALMRGIVVFAIVCVALPGVVLFDGVEARSRAFYVAALCLGPSFGMVFSRFQELTWQLLPPGTDVANSMGFNVMSRLLGVGIGNFVAGLILDQFYLGSEFATLEEVPAKGEVTPVYSPTGYVVLCSCCGICVLISCLLAQSAMELQQLEHKALQEQLAKA